MPFVHATKNKLKARVALDGPTGAGKTLSALYLARALAGPDGKIAGIDTERGSMRLYSDKVTFDVSELHPDDPGGFSPVNYVKAIHDAEKAKYDVIVIDSLTHAWEGEGGALDQVDDAASRIKGNSYAAWRNVTPMHREMVDAILQSSVHIVATMRSQMDYIQAKDKEGRTTITKVGMAPIQRKGMEYEFTLVGDMDVDHKLIITKSRCDMMADKVQLKPSIEFWMPFVEWLDSGDVAPVVIQKLAADKRTLKDVFDWAEQTYGIPETEAKDVLKAAGFTSYKHSDAPAVMAAISAGREPKLVY
jgi:hypothetical protein